jgi:hypothetical protein
MTDRNDAPVDGLGDYLARFMSHPRSARTNLDRVLRRRSLPFRYARPVGAALFAGVLAVVLGVSVAMRHDGNSGAGAYHGKQLDLVLRTVSGTGSATTPLAPFPHARYTFFTQQDPPNCLRGVQVQDADGHFVAGDRVDRVPQANVTGQDSVPLVQKDLPEGDYRVRIDTGTARCTWRVEQVLNSMSSPAAPPRAEPAPKAPSAYFSASSPDLAPALDTTTSKLPVRVTGIYRMGWTVYPRVPGRSCATVHFSLRNGAGDLEYQGVASGNPASPSAEGTVIGPLFLASGDHPLTITIQADCAFSATLLPWVGPLGGGSQGFAPPKTSFP